MNILLDGGWRNTDGQRIEPHIGDRVLARESGPRWMADLPCWCRPVRVSQTPLVYRLEERAGYRPRWVKTRAQLDAGEKEIYQ